MEGDKKHLFPPLTDTELADLRETLPLDSAQALFPVGSEYTARLVATIDDREAQRDEWKAAYLKAYSNIARLDTCLARCRASLARADKKGE
jgi:hypothetical protein